MTTSPVEPRGRTLLARIARTVLRHRRAVMVAWLVAFLAGGAAAGQLTKRLSVDFSLPGQPGYETARKIVAIYGSGGQSAPIVATVTAPAGHTVAHDSAAIGAAYQRLDASLPDTRLYDLANTGDTRFVTRDGRSTFALIFGPPAHGFADLQTPARARSVLRSSLPGYQVGITGLDLLSSGGEAKGPGVLAETIIGGVGALAILAFVYASFLAVLPLVIAAVSILTTLLVIMGLTYLTEVSFIVQYLVSLIGLGVAIDYSLLFVTRWREERAHGLGNEDAIVAAASTAGRTVALSGVTVAIGLLALVVLPVPGMRSVGLGGLLIPLVSVAVVLTLLPALLGGIGLRMDWPRVRREVHASRAWSAWARTMVRHRAAGFAVAAAILIVLVSPVFSLRVGQTSISALAQTGEAHATLARLQSGGIPDGILTPIQVLVAQPDSPAAVAHLRSAPGIDTVAVAAGPDGTRLGTNDVLAVPDEASLNNTSLAPVKAAKSSVAGVPGVVGLTGQGAVLQDFSHAVYGRFPLMFSVIALLSFLLLTFAFRSVVLSLKAVVLNLLSLGATFGFMT
ncbi:MAG TPA: MMPL family transporter, partial [Acidimicrobiales bacterium]|nr:MMPL family transporter [Acidimicrobiales bacterium]